MPWQQLTVHIDADELPQAEALLRLAGAESVSISDGGDNQILEPDPGATPLWSELTVRALFSGELDLPGIEALLGIVEPPVSLERIEDADLDDAIRQVVEAIPIGPRLCIVPAEEFEPGRPESLGLHMGLAFGTGRHPTTRLCLEWLEREFSGGGSVLDYGCGTGVLALAALRLGAGSATAVDNEAQALDAARRNARLNGLDGRLTIGPPNRVGSGPFELILANILARPLMDFAELFAAHQARSGRLVLSGILDTQLRSVQSCYQNWYEDFECVERDGWALLTGRRRDHDP